MLHIDVRGSGPDLVMVHGWAMHSGVWAAWVARLAGRFRVHCIDLPGHGYSELSVGDSLDDWSAALAEVAPAKSWWLGWSLGGLLTLNLARRYPDRVRGLIQVASAPRFVAAADWPLGVEPQVFDAFAAQLDGGVERALTRFLALQVRGADGSGASLRYLRKQLAQRPLPQAAALRTGLKFLRDTDLRKVPAAFRGPLYWLFGDRDKLVRPALGDHLPGRCTVIHGAGHAPFLSRPEDCAAAFADLSSLFGSRHAAG